MSDLRTGRRDFLTMAAVLALPVPKDDRLAFDVYRNGSRIGEQVLRFSRAGGRLTVNNHVELHVRLLAVRVFHYSAHIIEHWRDGGFLKATSAINDNGRKVDLRLDRQAGGVAVSGNRGKPYLAPKNALPLTYWNKAMLDGPMINMQTGHTDTPDITKVGWFRLKAEPSGTVTAAKYRLTGPIHLSVFYSPKGTWSGLDFDHEGQITYRPVIG